MELGTAGQHQLVPQGHINPLVGCPGRGLSELLQGRQWVQAGSRHVQAAIAEEQDGVGQYLAFTAECTKNS